MAATVRSSATYASPASEATAVVPLPAGYVAGDILYTGYELTASGGTLTPPAGWTEHVPQFRSAGTTSSLHGVLGRKADGTEGTSVTISFSSGRLAAVSAAVQGADGTTPEDGVTPAADANTGIAYPNVEAPSLTPASTGDLLLTWHAVRNGTNGATTSFTPPPGMASVAQASSAVAGVSNAAVALCSLALTSNAATGVKTAAASSSSGTLTNPMGSAAVLKAAGATVSGAAALMAAAALTAAGAEVSTGHLTAAVTPLSALTTASSAPTAITAAATPASALTTATARTGGPS